MSQARSSRDGLGTGLAQAMANHDLTKQSLMAAEKDLRRLQRMGALPNPTEYWQRFALPRASELVAASMAAISAEGEALGLAIEAFLDPLERGDLRQWAETDEGRAVAMQAAARAVGMVTEAARTDQPIHQVGLWWQQRLRRAALIRSVPAVLWPGTDRERVVGRCELRLLDGPPWSHGDRLLSAFEIAHGEIKTQVELMAEQLTDRVFSGGPRPTGPRHRLTIELRG